MLYNLICSVIFGFLFYFFGHITVTFWKNIKKQSELESFFFKAIIGVILTLIVYSIFKTSGNTIFTGLLLVIIVFLSFNKSQLRLPQKEDILKIQLKPFIIYVVAVILFSTLLHYIVFPDLNLIHNDYLYFGAIADYLNIYGIESNSLNINYTSIKPNLYHYANEWLAALISSFVNKNGTIALIYVYFPTMLGILYVGLYIIVNRISGSKRIINFLLPCIFFIIAPIAGGGGIPALFSVGDIDVSIGHYFSTPVLKFILIVLLLIVSILISNIKNETKVIFTFLVISFIWPTTTISIYGGVFLYVLYQKFFKSKLLYKEIVMLAVSVVYFSLFYTLQSAKDIILPDGVGYVNRITEYLKNDLSILQHLKYFFGTAIIRIYYFIIFILIIVLNWKTLMIYKNKILQHKGYIILYGFIVLSGLAGKSLLHFITDSNQVFENIFDHSFVYIAAFILLLIALKKSYNLVFILIFIATTSITFYYENSALKSEKITFDSTILKNEFEGKTYTFASHVKADGGRFNHISQVVYPPLTLLRAYSNSYFPVNLSLFDRYKYQYVLENDISRKGRFLSLMSKSAFYQYVMSKQIDNPDNKDKLNFLRENKIDYLVIEMESLDIEFVKELTVDHYFDLKDFNVRILKLNW